MIALMPIRLALKKGLGGALNSMLELLKSSSIMHMVRYSTLVMDSVNFRSLECSEARCKIKEKGTNKEVSKISCKQRV